MLYIMNYYVCFFFLFFYKFLIVNSIPTSKFYPYGYGNLDNVLQKLNHDESSPEVPLNVSVKFFGDSYSSLYINGNGLISFLIPLPHFISVPFPLEYPVLAALYTNSDCRGIGNIFYREDSNPTLLARAANDVHQAFSKLKNTFYPTSLFIATWDRMSHFREPNKLNTFQIVIISNGDESFVEFLYADDGIQWIQGPGIPDTGLPDAKAQSGMTAYNGRTYILPGSGTDQIRNLMRLSNTNEAGVWIFRVGDIRPEENVEVPDSAPILSPPINNSIPENSCASSFSLCHSQATCVDTNQNFCCVCRKGFFGNGITCLKEGVPIRATGKVNIDINGVRLIQQDLQVYIVTTDGRVYTAISKVPPSIGNMSQVLYPVTATLNWLFATPTNNGLNGFQMTGGILEHNAEITYKETNDRVLVVQKFYGINVFDQLKVDLQISGKIPFDILDKLTIDDYQIQFNFLAPGLLRSSSTLTYKFETPYTHAEVNKEILLEQTIKFNESCILDYNSIKSGQKGQYSYYRVKTSRFFITYEAPENILRFAATSKVSLLTDKEDPCIEGRVKCVVNSSCIVDGDSFKCTCNPGFRTTYTQAYVEGNRNDFGCLDINECAEDKNTCHQNAMCINEIGSYQCVCKHGFTGSGYQCTEIEIPCGKDFSGCNPPHSYCSVPNDYRTCDCKNGFQKKYIDNRRIEFVCIDIDECDNRPCGPNSKCRNLQGSYTCECKVGYSGDGYHCQRSNISCDINHNCSPNGECIFDVSTNKYMCRCIKGYYGDGYHCSAYGGRHVVPEVCIGSECFCPPNFVSNNTLCIDKDLPIPSSQISCNSLTSMCHSNAQCIYNGTSNQYYCACNSGYEGNGFDCTTIEMTCLKHDICDLHATCQVNNQTGKTSCACNIHYVGDGLSCTYNGMCTSDNECKSNEECYYNDDTLIYECRCKPNYIQLPNGNCSPNRQCSLCHRLARCITDSFGSGHCECAPGYSGDGISSCNKIAPPCNIENNCSPVAKCEYNLTSGSYECHCKSGFVGNGTTCSLIATCFENPELCDKNAKCHSVTVSGYTSPLNQCQCNNGFIGNGTYCSEIQRHEGGFLFVNWGTATLRVPYEPNISNPAYPIQVQADQTAIGLTIDCQRDRVYWSDYYGRKIKSSTFKGKNVATVVSGNISAPEGVALDWLNQEIYWTDSGNKVIEASNIDGTRRRLVVSTNLTNPRGISLDPFRRKLFWSDWNRAHPKIEWSSLDGSERSVFLSGPDVQLPNSIAIDISMDELCWADAGTKRIMCAGIETKQRRIVTSNCVSPFGLAVSSDKYYWTEKSLGKIGFFDKITEKSGNISLPSIGVGTLYGIVNVPLQC